MTSHHGCNGHELGQTPETVRDRDQRPAVLPSRDCRVDTTEVLNNNGPGH